MLVKEYRILLPLTVDEYRIAQLYMIQKKSSVESTGTDSGVEILVNEPYTDGPGGSGQYTYKVYHVGSHLPSWFRSILPKSALRVEEEAWNAYPYTKTRYTCPFVERFLLEVETVYHNDAGDQDNVFGLKDAELKDRIVDIIDIVNDQLPDHDYSADEDPSLYHSLKTGRGPLTADWVDDCKKSKEKAVMCAYKVCRVEFRYWGMQSKIEKFIHDIALRKTMLRAHRQAWAWQDEWFGLTIDDIRVLEKKAQEMLSKKMGRMENEDSDKENAQNDNNLPTINRVCAVEQQENDRNIVKMSSSQKSIKTLTSLDCSKTIDHLSAIRSDSLSDDEFFDAPEIILDRELAEQSESNLTRCSSMDLVNSEEKDSDQEPYSPSILAAESPPSTPSETKVAVLFFIFHGGPLLDASNKDDFDWSNADQYKNLDFTNFKLCLQKDKFDEDTTICCPQMPLPLIPILAFHSSHYKQALSQIIDKVNQMYKDFLLSGEGYKFNGEVCFVGDCTGGMFAYDCLTGRKHCAVSRNISAASNRSDITSISMTIKENEVFDFNVSGHSPSTCDLSETIVDTLVNTPTSFTTVAAYSPTQASINQIVNQTSSCKDYGICQSKESSLSPTNTFNSGLRSSNRLSSCNCSNKDCAKFPFYVSQLFLLGTPVGTVLTYRKLVEHFNINLLKPSCGQIFNLFYRLDPCSSRVEPLLQANFSQTPPINVPRYQQFPLGDGKKTRIDDWLKKFCLLTPPKSRELTPEASNLENESTSSSDTLETVKKDWWGDKRLDYALHCPEGLGTFPVVALPGIIHSSFWESHDVVAFLIRQSAYYPSDGGDSSSNSDYNNRRKLTLFTPSKPTEKWIKRTTSFKIRNSTANHRGNDVIVLEGLPQVLHARFVYGMLDVASLSGEKISVYIMENSENSEWVYYGESLSDNMIMAVIPKNTECVVFSIDGSFTASVSVSGRDPRVRPGAIDVVRHWQAAYGSTKDVHMYKEVGVDAGRIFVVGRASKKWQQQARVLLDGYTVHLMNLTSPTKTSDDADGDDLRRPANGKGRSILTKSHFFANLPNYYSCSTKKWPSSPSSSSNGVLKHQKMKRLTSDYSDFTFFDHHQDDDDGESPRGCSSARNLKITPASSGVQRTRSFTPRRPTEKRNVLSSSTAASSDVSKRSSLCCETTQKPPADDQDRKISSRHLSPFKFWSQSSSSKHKLIYTCLFDGTERNGMQSTERNRMKKKHPFGLRLPSVVFSKIAVILSCLPTESRFSASMFQALDDPFRSVAKGKYKQALCLKIPE
uniref:DDHD domain-containing protein n=1 Tax=Romanomermis culicivorax TaxID=13658 RepID=A0A915ICV0_ROMCU